MVKVKVCGITSFKDALASIAAGADALGFVFFGSSPRFISPLEAQGIVRLIPKRILRIGVFVNAPVNRVRKIAARCRLDMLQLHGEETPAYCRKLKGYKIIKAFRVQKEIDVALLRRYPVYAFLFDAFSPSQRGGTGRTFDWGLIRSLRSLGKPVFLSGGLNARNVRRAIALVRPRWVDVSSSVESSPGKKDYRKIKAFIRAAKAKGKKL